MTSDFTERPIHAGGVDWAAYWKARVEAREATRAATPAESGCRWDGRAERFAFLARSLDDGDSFVAALRSSLRSGDSVLDVGAGAGRYSMPIARAVRRVTAVEPSPRMRAELARAAAERGLGNLTIVPGRWEDAEVEPHDVAFAANVLYFVADAVRFIEKLEGSARRACFILHRVEERATPLLPLWERIWGRPRPPEPGALDLLNLVYSLGICADFQLAAPTPPARYENFDKALAEARRLLELPPDDRTRDVVIRPYLSDLLLQGDGYVEYPAGPRMAILSWRKG